MAEAPTKHDPAPKGDMDTTMRDEKNMELLRELEECRNDNSATTKCHLRLEELNVPAETDEAWKQTSDRPCRFVALFACPWILSVIISWLPFYGLSIRDAPQDVLLNAVVSTVELGTIVFFFSLVVYLTRFQADRWAACAEKPGTPRPAWMRWLSSTWLSFIVFSPMVTGIYMLLCTVVYPCTANDLANPRCHIHQWVINGVIAYRVIGVVCMTGVSLKAGGMADAKK